MIGSRYEILNEIGSGGMGRVFRARDAETRELVAVKLVHDGHRSASRVLRRFSVEATVLRRLDHPNIVRLKGSGVHRGRPYIVMELVEGESLHALIERRGRLSLARSVELAIDLCTALETIHAAGVIHRDVKPANVLVDHETHERLRVRLADFGLARLREYAVTRADETVGTPAFMAPEQAVGDDPDERTDIHGLGVLLYIMLTGEMPFEKASRELRLAYALERAAPKVSAIHPRCPQEVDLVVSTALRKNRAARYPTVAALRRDLERLAGRRPGRPRGGPESDAPDAYCAASPRSQAVAGQLRRRLAVGN